MVDNCDLCMKEISTKYNFKLRVTYGGRGNFFSRNVCKSCLNRLLPIPNQRINYFMEYVEFCRERRLSSLGFDRSHGTWNRALAIKFSDHLESKGIPVIDYGIPLCYEWRRHGPSRDVWLHKLVGSEFSRDDSRFQELINVSKEIAEKGPDLHESMDFEGLNQYKDKLRKLLKIGRDD